MIGTETSQRQAGLATSGIRILVVDDHPIVREGYTKLIEKEPDLTVCGEAESLETALQSIDRLRPHLAVVDISLKDGSGLELVKEARARFPHVRILVASMHDESLYAERVLRAGASGFIGKYEATEKLLTAIRHVLDGRVYLSREMTDRMLCRSIGSENFSDEPPVNTLSDRELEVFELIGQGVTTRQIAERLMLSPKTIETYRENIKTKLNLANATELTRHAVQWVLEQDGRAEHGEQPR